MKKIFNYILAVTALLAFAPIAKAQDYTFSNGVGARKTISAPDLQGNYYITLESFVQGEVKVTPKKIPADIVLVLDVSASMIRTKMGEAGSPEYVLINRGSDGRALTLDWSYETIGTNHYFIEYPYGSEQYYEIKREGGSGARKLYFVDGTNTKRWLTGGGTAENNGTGIIGGTWDGNMKNAGGEIAKAHLNEYNYGLSITDQEPAGVADATVIWRGPLYEHTNNFTRLHALQNAVATFLDIIYQKSTEDNLDNRISIVKFSGVYANNPEGGDALKAGNHYSDTNGGASTEVFQGWTSAKNAAVISDIKKDVKHLATGHGTSHDFGLNLAQKLLASLPQDTESRSKTVVLFTDGDPWRSEGMGSYTATVAQITGWAIQKAYDIKHVPAYESTEVDGTKLTHYTTIFTVGTGATGTQATNILNYCSSKYPEAKATNNTGAAAEGDYVFRAETAAELDAVFTAIANSSAESQASLDGQAVTTVDIVSKSFTLPQGTGTKVKVYTADCDGGSYSGTGDDRVFIPTFKDTVAFDATVSIKQSTGEGKYDEVDVVGFDYGANFCGPIVNQNTGAIEGYVGKKLVVRFPVKMDPDALGGPNAPTNAEGSGIFVAGRDDPLVTFKTPHVSLPYNIHITKTGLEKGESARFKIEKIIVQEGWITRDPDDNEIITAITVPESASWSPLTTVLVTEDGVSAEDPGIWVRGLPSTEMVDEVQMIVLYRVSEEPWSWSYNQKTAPKITDNNNIDNPFKFENEKIDQIKIKVRHAESKVRNIFKLNNEGGGVEYMDSKNERTRKDGKVLN